MAIVTPFGAVQDPMESGLSAYQNFGQGMQGINDQFAQTLQGNAARVAANRQAAYQAQNQASQIASQNQLGNRAADTEAAKVAVQNAQKKNAGMFGSGYATDPLIDVYKQRMIDAQARADHYKRGGGGGGIGGGGGTSGAEILQNVQRTQDEYENALGTLGSGQGAQPGAGLIAAIGQAVSGIRGTPAPTAPAAPAAPAAPTQRVQAFGNPKLSAQAQAKLFGK